MRLAIVTVTMGLLAVSCGGSEGSKSRLSGRWLLLDPSGAHCVTVLDLTTPAEYELDYICELDGGTYGTQAEAGGLDESGPRLTFSAERSSCPDDTTEPTSATYDFTSAGALRVRFPDHVLVFMPEEKSSGDASSAVVEIGCFQADGSFSRHSVVNL